MNPRTPYTSSSRGGTGGGVGGSRSTPVSQTDLLLFKALANPDSTNVPEIEELENIAANPHKIPQNNTVSYNNQQQNDIFNNNGFGQSNAAAAADNNGLNYPPSFRPQPAAAASAAAPHTSNGSNNNNMFRNYVQNELSRTNQYSAPKQPAAGSFDHFSPETVSSSRRPFPRHHPAAAADELDDDSLMDFGGDGGSMDQFSGRYSSNSGGSFGSFSGGGGGNSFNNNGNGRFTSMTNRYKTDYENMNTPFTLAELQVLRSELLRYKNQKGYIITCDIENAPAHVLRTELDLIHENESCAVAVGNMKRIMFTIMYVAEKLNKRFLKNYIPIEGWTDYTVKTNPNLYDHSLERIYNMYWRNSVSHPIAELGLTAFTSGSEYVVRNSMGGMMSNLMGGSGVNNNQQTHHYQQHIPQPQPPQQQQQQQQQPYYQQQQQQIPPQNPNMMPPPTQVANAAMTGRPSIRPPFTSKR